MKKIAIVDNNEFLLQTYQTLLSSSYEVFVFSNPLLALEELTKAPVDLIVLDYHMNEMNGDELAYKLKLAKVMTPIIFITADGHKLLNKKLFPFQAQAIIEKPVNAIKLEKVISDLIEGKDVSTESVHENVFFIKNYRHN